MLPQCAPPGSLAVWAAALLIAAVALGLAALVLAFIWRHRRTSRQLGASGLLGALLAVALAAWSLSLRARLLSVSEALTTSYRDDAEYCVTVVGHGGPGHFLAQYHGWLLRTTALVDSLQREALITIGVTLAFLLVAGALAPRGWRRDASAHANGGAPAASAGDDALHITDLDPHGRQTWRTWTVRTRRGRMLGALVALALIAASLSVIWLHARQAEQAAAETPNCSSAITASALAELSSIGLELYPTSDVVPVSAQAALTTSRQQVSSDVAANASCVVVALRRVQTSRLPELTLDQDIWVVAYHLPGSGGPQATASAAAPSDHWLFIDAHDGVYVGGTILLSSAGG